MTPAAGGPTGTTDPPRGSVVAEPPRGSVVAEPPRGSVVAEPPRGTLGATSGPLVTDHDVLLLDLDGTVWLGGELLPQALPVLSRIAGGGVRLLYVTNNASRSPVAVAAQLSTAGLATDGAQVVTSAQAAASLLAERVPPGSPVLVIGADALEAEAADRGLRPVRFGELHSGRLTTPGPGGSDRVVAVLQGFSPDTSWRDLAAACHAVADGALWVAANVDATLPTAEGLSPGNGSLVAVVATVTGRTPVVAGKPERPLLDTALQRSGARRPLVVGDRLDTDLAAAVATDLPGLLVLTGVSQARDLLEAPPSQRPRYLGADLGALEVTHHAPRPVDSGWECGPWRAEVRADVVALTASGQDRASGGQGGGADGSEPLAGLRALAEAVWEYADRAGALPGGLDEAVARVEAARVEAARVDVGPRADPEDARTPADAVAAGSDRAAESRQPEQPDSRQSESESGQAQSERAQSGQAQSGQAQSGQAQTGSGSGQSGPDRTGNVEGTAR